MQVPSQFIIQQYPVIGHQPQLRRISTDCSSPPIKTPANNNNILNINNNLNNNQSNYLQLNHNASNNSLLNNNNSCNNDIPMLPNHNNNIDTMIDTNSNNTISLNSGVLGTATKRTMDDVLRKLTNKFRGSTIGGDGQRQPTPPPEQR